MSLLDWFRPKRDAAPPPLDELRKLWSEVGALGATVQTLTSRLEGVKDEWITQRDEMRRLAQRLEKRDQRAAKNEEPDEEPELFSPEVAGMRAIRARRQARGH